MLTRLFDAEELYETVSNHAEGSIEQSIALELLGARSRTNQTQRNLADQAGRLADELGATAEAVHKGTYRPNSLGEVQSRGPRIDAYCGALDAAIRAEHGLQRLLLIALGRVAEAPGQLDY